MNGKSVKCIHCNGHGQVARWSFGVIEPDECRECGGSGLNWQYTSGAVARYYSGPFLSGPTTPARSNDHAKEAK